MACLALIAVRWLPANPPVQKPQPPSTVVVTPAPTNEPPQVLSGKTATITTERLEQEIRSYDQNDTHVHAFNALAEQWGVRPIKIFSKGGLDVPGMFRRTAAKRNLRVTLFKGSLDEIVRYDQPFIVATKVTGGLGAYCYAVTAAHGETMTLSPALFDSHTISRNDLASIASGTFYLIWHNPWQIPNTVSKGEKSFEIKVLQRLLKQAGFFNGEMDGDYSAATADAVGKFQQSKGIPANESLGELTVALLSRYDTSSKVPSLKGS
jgi:general secretion pathway protein A